MYNGFDTRGWSFNEFQTHSAELDDFLFVEVKENPQTELIPLATIKSYMKVDHSDDDTLIQTFVDAGIDLAIKFLQRSLINRTLYAYFEGNQTWKRIPFPNVQSIVEVQRETDTPDDYSGTALIQGNEYTLQGTPNDKYIHVPSMFTASGRVQRKIRIEYVSGYGENVSDVPYDLQIKIYKVIHYLYQNREYMNESNKTMDMNDLLKAELSDYRDIVV